MDHKFYIKRLLNYFNEKKLNIFWIKQPNPLSSKHISFILLSDTEFQNEFIHVFDEQLEKNNLSPISSYSNLELNLNLINSLYHQDLQNILWDFYTEMFKTNPKNHYILLNYYYQYTKSPLTLRLQEVLNLITTYSNNPIQDFFSLHKQEIILDKFNPQFLQIIHDHFLNNPKYINNPKEFWKKYFTKLLKSIDSLEKQQNIFTFLNSIFPNSDNLLEFGEFIPLLLPGSIKSVDLFKPEQKVTYYFSVNVYQLKNHLNAPISTKDFTNYLQQFFQALEDNKNIQDITFSTKDHINYNIAVTHQLTDPINYFLNKTQIFLEFLKESPKNVPTIDSQFIQSLFLKKKIETNLLNSSTQSSFKKSPKI